MKLFLILTLFFIGCKETVDAPEDWKIEMKRDQIASNFRIDSIRAATEYENELIRTTNMSEKMREEKVRTHMVIFYSKWNSPYSIMKDTALTMKTYLEYCKNYGHDPKTYINFMK